MLLILKRFAYLPRGTYGHFFLEDGTEILTVEQPWRDNRPYHSCVPEGKYELYPHNGSPGKGEYALVNHELNVYYQPADAKPGGRFACLFGDVANHPDQVEGCIAFGMNHFWYGTASLKPYLSVGNSALAHKKVMNAIGEGRKDLTLSIEKWDGVW